MSPCDFSILFLAYLLLDQGAMAYTAVPRWGQATTIINDALFIHGGKTDQYNSYSYTSAPTTNDLLYLSLSSPFAASSPPWQAISGLANSSTSTLSPALAWHTLSAFNTSEILLFGGQPGLNSSTVLTVQADSAVLLNVFDRMNPGWILEPIAWAGEPIRRIHHSTCSYNGEIWIFGGEKADGSGNALSDHYVFNPNTPSFTQLSSTNGPTEITGHVSIVLSNGLILVFGGVSEGALVSFTEIWIFDVQSMAWSLASVSSSPVPPPRRAFAAVLLSGDKILIHGGCDAVFQETYSDGWILDTTQNPMVWSEVGALSQLGARRDHFAVAQGDQVIFGFGYGSNSPASADLQIYDFASGTWSDSFSPIPITASPTMTLPGPTQTSNHGSPNHGGTGTSTGLNPSNTVQTPDGGNGSQDGSTKGSYGSAIAIGVTLGTMTLVGSAFAVAYYLRQRNTPGTNFHIINGYDDNGRGPHLAGLLPGPSVAHYTRAGNGGHNHTLMNSLGLGVIASAAARVVSGRTAFPNHERRDMLADEDTREFGWGYMRAHEASAGSTWSLRSVGALFGGTRRNIWSREPSASSTANTHLREKTDPFSDGAALLLDNDIVSGAYSSVPPPAAALRSRGERDANHSSYSTRSYTDPFADPIQEEWDQYHNIGHKDDVPDPSLRLVQPGHPPPLMTMYPPSTGIHTLSPLTEQASRGSMSIPSNSSHSHDNVVSAFESSQHITSHTSHDGPLRSPSTQRHTSIVDSQPPGYHIRRSDTWWSRFSRSSFLDRRNSDGTKPSGMLDIRDPNPPPRLVAIEEKSVKTESPESSRDNSQIIVPPSRRGSRMHGVHGRSQSSLQTARTADSETLERMGAVDVVQRLVSESRRTRDSTTSSAGTELDLEPRTLAYITNADPDDDAPVTSPQGMSFAESLRAWTTSPQSETPSPQTTPSRGDSSPASSPPARPKLGGAVAARVQAYERRMSQDQTPSPVSPGTRKKTGRVSINYGLVPRPSLFVANPDHRITPSTESS
jgi:hypothetical protein